jgi:predicted DNA-binding transcriptional regulator AlpA
LARLLSSWKEIAQYTGKGVRTLQRWEQDLGFPVRRPAGGGRQIVMVTTDEVDTWIAARTERRNAAVDRVYGLRARLAVVEQENERLRQMLAPPEPIDNDALFHHMQSLSERMEQQSQRSDQLSMASAKLNYRSRSLVETSRTLRNGGDKL